ncbi:hypothetical protein ACSDQ9_13300 [Aestuariimicrobium soli]|uniref:hypothetical protein n=1 Tax=Aestuariimicrobium soli TaxID=2035834 RepID=UPI003EB9CF95
MPHVPGVTGSGVTGLALHPDHTWSLATELEVDDEREAVWLSSLGLVATVRQVVNDQWRLRVRVVNDTATAQPITGLRLELDADDPVTRTLVRRWGGGARAFLMADDGESCVLARQVTGFALDDDLPGLRLFPGTTLEPGAATTCEWALEPLGSPRDVLAHLPAWWPDRLVRRGDDPVVLGDGTELLPTGDRLTIPEERGETVLAVVSLPGMDEAVAHALAHPACAGAAEVVLRQAAPGTDDLAARVEELLSRGAPDPLAVIAAARELAATGSSDLVDVVTDALDRLRGDDLAVGVARMHAALALTAAGAPVPELGPVRLPSTTDLALLGGGLPGRGSAAPLDVARTIAACALLPPAVGPWPPERWPVPFDEVILQATAEVLACDPDPEVVAWLVLGNAW